MSLLDVRYCKFGLYYWVFMVGEVVLWWMLLLVCCRISYCLCEWGVILDLICISGDVIGCGRGLLCVDVWFEYYGGIY